MKVILIQLTTVTYYLLLLLVLGGSKPRDLHMLGKCSATEL